MTAVGREVTDLVCDFHRAIRDLYPHFLRFDLTVGSDEWQETCGSLLATLVVAPARGLTTEDIASLPSGYALWDPLGTVASELLVAPEPRVSLYMSWAVPSGREPGTVISFREARASDIDGLIQFREFANPLSDETDLAVLDYAVGYAKSRGGLVRVAVPVIQARFYLANSVQ